MRLMKSFYFFVIKSTGATFYRLSVCETVYENTKAALFRVALICDNKITVFYMDDAFDVLSKPNVCVHGVRTIPVGFKTKLNTFFDIAVVW